MIYFPLPANVTELKARYRRLVSLHHPDKGGNASRMQAINEEYEHYLSLLQRHQQSRAKTETKPTPSSPLQVNFTRLKVGDTVYVNATECEVLELREDRFLVVAKSRARQAWFDRKTGRGLFNPRLQAAHTPLRQRRS